MKPRRDQEYGRKEPCGEPPGSRHEKEDGAERLGNSQGEEKPGAGISSLVARGGSNGQVERRGSQDDRQAPA
jgi:hypothetical protein